MLRETIVLFCVGVAAVASSPHADYIDALYRNVGSSARISDNILEDASLDVPDLIRKYRYPVEVHSVTTEDGYILEMHRIPHGRDRNNLPGSRPVVFLMHGLLSSSADWVLKGPGCAFSYILAEAGFDVWMGNARGNYYSRRHTRLNPNSLLNTAFWQFSWDEIGNIDLPTMIDFVLARSGRDRLHYVGHSQGTTSFFVMGSLHPQYANEKIISMHAFAPVAYMAHNESPLLRLLSHYSSNIESALSLIGIGEFLPNSNVMTWAGQALCMDEATAQQMCSNIIFLLGGWNECQHNATMLPLKLGHAPAGAASRQFIHYAQGISGKEFRRYDHGSILSNWRAYGSNRPPFYQLNRIMTPVFLHYSDSDPLSHVNDVDRLFRELGRPIGKFRIPMATFSHMDFIWGVNAEDLLYTRTINLIRTMDVNGFVNEDDMK